MNAMLAIAGLTVREAVRRNFVVAGLLICGLFAVVAYIPIHPRPTMVFDLSPEEVKSLTAALIASRGSSMVAFFSFLFAVALGAGTISGEIERGVMSVVAPKPIGRASIYVGKWIGLNLFILPFTLLWTALLQWAIYKHIGHTVPGLWHATAILALYPATFTAITMLFSSFTSTLLATIMPMILASTAWSEGILKVFGNMFDVATLKLLARIVVFAAPLNPLSRWVERVLDQPILERVNVFSRMGGAPDPPAQLLDLAWIAIYAAAALLAGLVIFQRRDLAA
jgi:ABC-type transport system involved in multi-copper enzyme maturation permease subunit